MNELFERFVTYLCFAGLGILGFASLIKFTLPIIIHDTKEQAKRIGHKGSLTIIIPLIFTSVLIVRGGSKSNSQTNEPPPRMHSPHLCVENDTSSMTNALVCVEKWWRRGAFNDGHVVTFDDDWCFPYYTNHLSHIEIWASGAVYASEKSPTPIAEIVTKLSLKPHDTEVLVGRTTNNSYRVEWHRGHPNRADDQTTDASIELCRNGTVITTENGVATVIPYGIPFAHNGFGQDDDWVLANFTNATEILGVGYANWVNAQVGIGLTNGLYKFTASFKDIPPEPTQFYIGSYSVCVTNSGEYVFLLEKGCDYEFGTWPFTDCVDYYAQDDMANDSPILSGDSPMFISNWNNWESTGEWSIDGGENRLDYPRMSKWGCQNGCCCMMPTLQGFPNLTHLGPEDFPMTFNAILSDITQNCAVSYEWTTDTECFYIDTPNAKTTRVLATSIPSWTEASMSVTASFKNKSLTSNIQKLSVGTNATPTVTIFLHYPNVIFLNDDRRSDRIYRLSAVIKSDSATNGIFRIEHTGNDNPLISTSTNFVNTSRSFSYRFNLTKNCLSITNHFYVMSQDVQRGAFVFSCTLKDGTNLTTRRDYNVIEPLCKLITTQKGPDGRYLNPSRLVYGTNAWLQVGVRGDFPSSQIQWSITPDSCRYLQVRDYGIQIEPTATSGIAVVRARFNDDPHQPTFTLPIVMPRTIPVKAFIVNDAEGNMVTTIDRVRRQISTANEIFDQVGIKFDLEFLGRVMSTNFHTLAQHDISSNGSTNITTVSAQALSLFNVYTNRDCVEIYYVSKITNSTSAGFYCNKGIVMSSYGSDHALAHELGHALGARDCYAVTKQSDSVTQWFASILPRMNYFNSAARDWGEAKGRGFYEQREMYNTIISKCLMNGFDGHQQSDIPDDAILSLKRNAKTNLDIERTPVGASVFERKRNEEVYSR